MSNSYVNGDEGRVSRDTMLAQRFVTLADTLVDDFDLLELLDRLVESVVELLDVSAAGLLLIDQRGHLSPVASSSEATRLLELFQLQNQEGPCLDCVHTGSVVTVPALEEMHDRWPLFAPAAEEYGFASVHALPMRLRSETIGSLNLFNAGRPPLEPEEQRIAQALADVATIGILQQRSRHRASMLAEQLQTALNSRILIEQAKGVLAEYGGVDMDAAFYALRQYARNSGVKLSTAAEFLVRRELSPDEFVSARPTPGGRP